MAAVGAAHPSENLTQVTTFQIAAYHLIDNRKDYEELPVYLKEGLEVHFVKTFGDVYQFVF